MALIERFHVVAAERPVASGQTILEGMVVSLNSSGEIVLMTSAAATQVPYGIAADTKSDSYSTMPGVTDVVVSADGSTTGMQNRVSDGYNETKASGKMTVYHSGGEFATDQFVDVVSSAAVLKPLYADVSGTGAACGKLTTVTTNGHIVAYLLQAAGAYPSGVPGVDSTTIGGVALNGDRALQGRSGTAGTGNTYIEIKLVI